MKGDESLSGMFAVNGAARADAEAVIAALPATEQSEYSTPEKLAALAFSDMITKQTAAEILGKTESTSSDATVSLAGNNIGTAKVLMQLTADGWQLSVSSHLFDKIVNRLKVPTGAGN